LALKAFFDFSGLDLFFLVSAQPEALDATSAKLRLGRWRIERRSSVEAVDFDEYRPCFRRAAPS